MLRDFSAHLLLFQRFPDGEPLASGTAFRKSATMFFTFDDFQTRSAATLSNPFPNGLTGPQNQTYGKLAEWGYGNGNDLGTTEAQNAAPGGRAA